MRKVAKEGLFNVFFKNYCILHEILSKKLMKSATQDFAFIKNINQMIAFHFHF